MSFKQEKVNAHQDLIARVTSVREELRELRRYVRTNPDFLAAAMRVDTGPLKRLDSLRPLLPVSHTALPARLCENALAALPYTRACPEAMEGYLAGADWELAVLIDQLEKETPR